MEETLDCRGLACPQPVLRVKDILEQHPGRGLQVLVDNEAAKENVKRFAQSRGCAVAVEQPAAGLWGLQLNPGAGPAPTAGSEAQAVNTVPPAPATVLLVLADRIGPAEELGAVLMKAFLNTLGETSALPEKLLFLNTGVLLTTEGSPVLDTLTELEARGVTVLSCGTCLEFLDRKDSLRVGSVSNMYETVETLLGPHKIVSLR